MNVEKVNAKELRGAIKALNDSGLLDKAIVLKGKNKEKLCEELTEAMESINKADKLEEAPDEAVDVYNTLHGEEEPEKKAPASAKKTTVKKAATSKGKKERRPSYEETALELVKAGATNAKILKTFTEIYNDRKITDEAFIASRVKIYVGIAKRAMAAKK